LVYKENFQHTKIACL